MRHAVLTLAAPAHMGKAGRELGTLSVHVQLPGWSAHSQSGGTTCAAVLPLSPVLETLQVIQIGPQNEIKQQKWAA